jgi:dTDP-4-amino-4,6-dideoxygalactose transaminase
MFYLLAADLHERTALIAHLREGGILAAFHYVPLHSSPFAKSRGLPMISLPITDDTSSRLLRLPMYYDLTNSQVDSIVDFILDLYKDRVHLDRYYNGADPSR